MSKPSWNNKVIYIPIEGMPLVVPQSHIYAREILEGDFSYIDLPALSGFSFVLYQPSEVDEEAGRNNWLSNLYRGAKYNSDVRGPALAVVSSTADQKIVQPAALHLQLLQDAVFQEASSRAAILRLQPKQ
jgi:hypothetical protein